MSAPLREAASVILLRPAEPGTEAGFEVFLLRRHRQAKFMASAFVFPGGAAEPGEDARTAAARELFEEAGVLLAHADSRLETKTLEMPIQAQLRRRMHDPHGDFAAIGYQKTLPRKWIWPNGAR